MFFGMQNPSKYGESFSALETIAPLAKYIPSESPVCSRNISKYSRNRQETFSC